MRALLDGRAISGRLGFHIPCITRQCYTALSSAATPLDVAGVTVMLAIAVQLALTGGCCCAMHPRRQLAVIFCWAVISTSACALVGFQVSSPCSGCPSLLVMRCLAVLNCERGHEHSNFLVGYVQYRDVLLLLLLLLEQLYYIFSMFFDGFQLLPHI